MSLPARPIALSIAAAFTLIGCASGGSSIVTAQPVPASSGAPASVPAGPPHGPSRRLREVKRVTLLDASGSGPEVDAFVGQFLSDVSDKDLFVLADARLTGASLATLAADPAGPAATRFRTEWPSDAYLSVSMGQCYIKTNRVATPDTSLGYQTMRVSVMYDATCPATLKLADAEDGHVLATVEATGTASYHGDTESGETPAEEEAARDAAKRAVKKLRGEFRR